MQENKSLTNSEDHNIATIIQADENSFPTDPEIANKFYSLSQQWKTEVEGMSSPSMFQHSTYEEIINLGTKVIPLLLEDLTQNPLFWLSALNTITGVNPIKPEQRGKVKQMAGAWLEWGKNQGYLFEKCTMANGQVNLVG